MRVSLLLLVFSFFLDAQLTTGVIDGSIRNLSGRPAGQFPVFISGRAGFRKAIHTDKSGHFTLSLLYGPYTLSCSAPKASTTAVTLYVEPLQTVTVNVVIDSSGSLSVSFRKPIALIRQASAFPQGFSLQSIISTQTPGIVAVPLNFTGLGDNRLALISERGLSWTNTRFKLQGLDATDSYQPGRPAILPDVEAIAEVVDRTGLAFTASDNHGSDIDAFLAEPETSWHGTIATSATGSAFSSSNVPRPFGLVQRPERFNWFSRDRLQAGGPITPWADLFASVGGQWSSQTVELAGPEQDQKSRALFANLGSTVRASANNWFDIAYSGSRLSLSNWGMPAGMEALVSRRTTPDFDLSNGFSDEAEGDRFHFLQMGWIHLVPAGTVQMRYGYSVATLDTWAAMPMAPNQSRIELTDRTVAGAPPLATLATRPRHEIAVAYQPRSLNTGQLRHHITIGGNWEVSSPRNQMTTPSDLNLITATGAAAYVVEYNTPVNSLERIKAISAYFADHLIFRQRLSLDASASADISQGSLPAQSSTAGSFVSARTYQASGNLIDWRSVSPRIGFAWQLPFLLRPIIRGGYLRSYSPLAGRYLDYANPNSLGGSIYQWIDRNSDDWFEPNEQRELLMRFGGPYSSIARSLRRPYADELGVRVEFVTRNTVASVEVFRRDEKNRVAIIDNGLGPNAFIPVQILDPGPDGLPGTFDDQHLIVYEQNPSTWGKDRYVLTNPARLRELNTGLVADVRTAWRGFTLNAAFTAEKAWGPTNPGNAVFENDPDVIGTLFIDPNHTNPTLARSYVDRAYLGTIKALYQLPSALGRLELASVANYTDGLPFARELLVNVLAQGPLVVPTTVRGSPEGGNRAQYVFNWNLRVAREFRLHRGRLAMTADVLNVTNSSQAIQQIAFTGPAFNLRLPVAIQPARFMRFELAYSF